MEGCHFAEEMSYPFGRTKLADDEHGLPRLRQRARQRGGKRRGQIGILRSESIEATPVERTGLDIRQGIALKRVVTVDVQIADAVSRNPYRHDLAAAIVERPGNRDQAFPDLEENRGRVAGTEKNLVPLPVTNASQPQQLLKSFFVQGLAKVQMPADAVIAWQVGRQFWPRERYAPGLTGIGF